MKASQDDLHVLTGSYVLDAISDAEREEFERHLQYCPACEAEVRGLREAVVSTTGMASLPSGRVYQVWVISPSGARSAGLLHGTSLLASAVARGDRIGITVEPAGGTARPTTNPVAVVPV